VARGARHRRTGAVGLVGRVVELQVAGDEDPAALEIDAAGR
jgi:hypothetical protein